VSIRKQSIRQISQAFVWALALLPIVGTRASLAQSRSDGSVYARFGVGERKSFYSSQAQAMGVLGTALQGPAHLNLANPAAYADQYYTRFGAGLDFVGVQSKDDANQTSTSSGGALGAVQLGFPLMVRKLGLAASISPYTTSGYHAQTSGVLEAEGGEPFTEYQVNYEGDGGLHEATFGLGYQVSDALAVGAAVKAIWGIIEFGQRTEFGSTVDYLSTTEQVTSTRMSGFSGSIGFLGRTKRLLGKNDALSFGAAFTFPVSMSGTRTNLVNQGVVLVDTVGMSVKGDLTLPLRVQAGVSWSASQKWLLLADGIYEPWGKFKSDFPLFGYTPGQDNAFNSRFRFGAGAQVIPAGNDPFASKIKRTAYRMGFFAEQSYARPQPDYKLVTYGMAAGLSIPTIIPGTSLDITGQIGRRGKATSVLVQDLLYKISITLNFGERWFLQRRLR